MSAKNAPSSSSPQFQSVLAQEIANWLHLPPTKAIVRRFADMEIFVEIRKTSALDVFIIQSTSFPANDHLMELLIITDALRRASARRITAVIPYFGYARQDRKPAPNADLGQAGGQHHHPCRRRPRHDARFARRANPGLLRHSDRQSLRLAVMVRDIRERFDLGNVMVCRPMSAAGARAGLASASTRRWRSSTSAASAPANPSHECDRRCRRLHLHPSRRYRRLRGTLVNAADALLANGAKEVSAYITHGVLSAVRRPHHLLQAERTRHHRLDPADRSGSQRAQHPHLSIASLIAEAIGRTASEESVSSLFD